MAYSFGQSLGPVTFAGKTQNYVGTVGARFKFGAGWQATLSESYGRETLFDNGYNLVDQDALSRGAGQHFAATAFNFFSGAANPAAVAGIRREDVLHAVSTIETTSFIADGPLFNLPAGAAKIAVGLERREESLGHTVPDLTGPSLYSTENARYSRHVGSAFTELSIPLVGSAENRHAAPRLELTLAGRYEDYSDFGHTANPEFRLRFAPHRFAQVAGELGQILPRSEAG